MNDQIVDSLLQEYILYSRVQRKLEQALLDCDETMVLSMELQGREILERLEPKLSLVLTSVTDGKSSKNITPERIQSLVQCIEKSQGQVSRNQSVLSQWKNEIGNKLQELSTPTGKCRFQDLEKNPSSGTPTETTSSSSPSPEVGPSHSAWECRWEKIQIGQKFDRLS